MCRAQLSQCAEHNFSLRSYDGSNVICTSAGTDRANQSAERYLMCRAQLSQCAEHNYPNVQSTTFRFTKQNSQSAWTNSLRHLWFFIRCLCNLFLVPIFFYKLLIPLDDPQTTPRMSPHDPKWPAEYYHMTVWMIPYDLSLYIYIYIYIYLRTYWLL